MMVSPDIYAPSDWWTEWDSIDWSRVHAKVRRLQVRIAEAVREGNRKKVKALQRLLVTSRSARLAAVRRVTTNKGKQTPGVDGVIWDTPRKKVDAVKSLKGRGYKPMPLRRIYIPKRNGTRRPLGIPTMKDRAMQALYKMALEPIAETLADKNSYGFRPYRSVADALQQCYIVLARRHSATWLFEADIEACFDNIDHDWILANIPMDKVVLRKWLKAGYLEKGRTYPTDKGTPQGGIISPVLANMVLDGLEKTAREAAPKMLRYGDKVALSKIHVIRYADDFIVTCGSKETLTDKVIPAVVSFLRERGLEISAAKSKITNVHDGFEFLGAHIRKYTCDNRKSKTLIKPAKSGVKRFTRETKEVIRRNPQAKTVNLIHLLNRKIGGWANHHRPLVSGRIFKRFDHEVWKTLWKWAKRRHPRKRRDWVKRRYFGTRTSVWAFYADHRNQAGEIARVELIQTANIGIRRHVKVRAEARLFDPAYDMYFAERRERLRQKRQQDRLKRFYRTSREPE